MASNALPHRVVFAGCARDVSAHLDGVFANILALAARCEDAALVCAINDCNDDTPDRLKQWSAHLDKVRLLCVDGLASNTQARTVRLATARNALVSCIRGWPLVAGFDTLVMLDMDEVNASPWPEVALDRALTGLHAQTDTVGIFANQRRHHYDLWALREPNICPGDVWVEAFDHAIQTGLSDEQVFQATVAKRMFCLSEDAPPMEVDSAFGGLGLYKLRAVLANLAPYAGETCKVWGDQGDRISRWQCCEHVSFHTGLRAQGGRLFIWPDLINGEGDAHPPVPSAFRSLAF